MAILNIIMKKRRVLMPILKQYYETMKRVMATLKPYYERMKRAHGYTKTLS